MFIHLGGDTIISMKSIVAIISAEFSLNAETTREFLKTAEEEGFLKKLSNNDDYEYKSIIITEKYVYLSPISSVTLKKRAEFIDSLV